MIAHLLLAVFAATVAVTTPSGTRIDAEIASTSEARERGLMDREALPADAGMLFVFPEDGVYTFWMKNTRIPLDIIWLDSSHTVTFISRDTPPCPVMRVECPTYGPDVPARYVLEIGAGRAAELSIREGARLGFDLPENLPPPVALPESTIQLTDEANYNSMNGLATIRAYNSVFVRIAMSGGKYGQRPGSRFRDQTAGREE